MSKFAVRILSNGRSERARAALQSFAEKSPGFGALTIWANQVDAEQIENMRALPRAWTDGRTVFYSERFEKLEHLNEKTGIVGHETWHIAFCHPQRAMKLAKENADFNAFFCNLAMDAIINEGLKSPGTPYEWLKIRDTMVSLLDLLKRVLGEDWTREEALAAWSFESLYHAMMDKTPRHPVQPSSPEDGNENQDQNDDPSAATDDESGAEDDEADTGETVEDMADEDGTELPDPGDCAAQQPGGSKIRRKKAGEQKVNGRTGGGIPKNGGLRTAPHGGEDESFNAPSQIGNGAVGKPANGNGCEAEGEKAGPRLESNYDRAVRYAKEYGFDEDIEFDVGGEYDPEKIEKEMRLWARRLEIARAGEGSNGILRRIIADMPVSVTPWQVILRGAVTPALMRRLREDWGTPARRWISMHGMPGYEDLPFEPGTGYNCPAMRLVICADTSGSVDDTILSKFSSEIRSIQRLTNCEIHVIVGDDRVHDIWKLRPNDGLRGELTSVDGKKVVFRGDGGTNFEPLLAAAAELKPSIVVYLTDLQGPTGPKPKGFDVVWAVPKDMRKAAPVPDFGRVIEMQ